MKTRYFTEDVTEAAGILKDGGLVAVPTETVYGLAGNGLDEGAVRNIYEVKGRPAVKPLSLMVPDKNAMKLYCEDVPEQAIFLADRFWPGPLTIVLKSRPCVPEIVRAGGETVGLRCPDHPLTLKALKLAGIPFAAPSANPSGEESPKNAEKVREYFDGKIEGIIDGGECGIGKESTLIDMSRAPYRILRQGALSEGEIAGALAENMTVIGVTGGSGTGKSTAVKAMEELGAFVIDCDSVYHRLLETDCELINELKCNFEGVIVGGRLDRKALGRIVFADPEALKRLNKITHFYVRNEIKRLLCAHALNGGTLAAIDASELFDGHADEMCTLTVGIISEREKRIERITARDGISREYAEKRISAQHDDAYFREKCDIIIENDSTKEEFYNKCMNIFTEAI
ncbi:MAG: L-threonylcarbamoyladenylate synthase [Eubacteriales bacterium]|nr:L-threonylcarbamoyladenylate synthase [Eubacteriales bacterium]